MCRLYCTVLTVHTPWFLCCRAAVRILKNMQLYFTSNFVPSQHGKTCPSGTETHFMESALIVVPAPRIVCLSSIFVMLLLLYNLLWKSCQSPSLSLLNLTSPNAHGMEWICLFAWPSLFVHSMRVCTITRSKGPDWILRCQINGWEKTTFSLHKI